MKVEIKKEQKETKKILIYKKIGSGALFGLMLDLGLLKII